MNQNLTTTKTQRVKAMIKDFFAHRYTAPALFVAVVILSGVLYWNWPPPAAVAEPPSTTGERIWAGYYTALVHVRYHHAIATWSATFELLTNVIITAVAIMLVVTAAYAINKRLPKRSHIWILGTETVITAISVVLVMVDFGDMSKRHADLAHEWEVLANDWDEARMARATDTPEQLKSLLAELTEKQLQIAKASPDFYLPALLRSKQREVNRFLGATPAPVGVAPNS
jgi:hypothetical protein